MKGTMKKIWGMLLVVIIGCVFSTTVVCAKEGELTDEIILSLTADDYEECYDRLLEYKESNPNCTDKELDAMAEDIYIQLYMEKSSMPSACSFYDDLVATIDDMNAEELALAKKYPSDLAAVYSSTKIANREAKSRYNSGAYLGNQDAFRHAAWNALIICRFYALGKGDYTWCMNRTREWTTAHETGAEADATLSAAQRKVDYEMDILNNAAGRAAAETTYTSEAAALAEVQEYVDNGYCKRIKTDSQTTYSLEQMAAISTWKLRATNTVGKK